MKIKTDSNILSVVYAQAAATNAGATAGKVSGDIDLGSAGSPLAVTKDNILDVIADLGLVLDEADVPEEDRKLTLPSWATRLVKSSDFRDASLAGDNTSIFRNGRLGILDRFEVFTSNNVAHAADGANEAFEVFANHKSALTFAAQIAEEQTGDLGTTGFGAFAKILTVYGFKVTNADGLAHAHIMKG